MLRLESLNPVNTGAVSAVAGKIWKGFRRSSNCKPPSQNEVKNASLLHILQYRHDRLERCYF